MRATATVWAQLNDPEQWLRCPSYQAIVDQARAVRETSEVAEWFNTRYLDLGPIEHRLLDGPNRNPS